MISVENWGRSSGTVWEKITESWFRWNRKTHIKNYMFIQKIRYGDRLQVFYNIDVDAAHVHIPRFILAADWWKMRFPMD